MNLQDFYKYCRNIYQIAPPTVQPIINELDYAEYITYDPKQQCHTVHLLAEGVRCGSCVWLIEHTLKAQQNVINARLNLSTNRLTLSWQGAAEQIADLAQIINQLGYKLIPFDPALLEQEYKKQEHDLLKRLGVAFFALANVMMFSIGVWAGNASNSLGLHTRELLHYLAAIITIPTAAYSGMPFYHAASKAISAKRSNMDISISLAIVLTLIISMLETWQSNAYTYFDAVLSLMCALLTGRYLELRARNKARNRARQLVLAQARSATILRNDKHILTSIKNVQVGDEVFVASGAAIPVDGVVINGQSAMDNSLITGESLPVAIAVGSAVQAGTVNLGDAITIRVTSCGENTMLGEIIRLMEHAEQGRAKYVNIADKVSRFYTPVVLSLSAFTFAMWFCVWFAPWQLALLHAVCLLIITCPCALAIAVPVVQVAASSRLFGQGIYLRTADALEKLANANAVLFDKTGTLTLGRPILQNRAAIPDDVFQLIAQMAAASNHPLCKAICTDANYMPLHNVQEKQGVGLSAQYEGRTLYLGKMAAPTAINDDVYSEVWFKDGETSALRLIFQDQLRIDAQDTIAMLKKQGKRIVIISGDRQNVVKDIAQRLNIDEYYAECSPADKCNFIKNLQASACSVLMIGDGLNDAAALKQADVSISPVTALDLPQSCADAVFTGSKLHSVIEALAVAKQANLLVKENFTIAFTYNIISMPLAFAGLVTPLIATIAMSTSSLLVILNALRLLMHK